MPLVARKFIRYEEGSPEEALQQAITARYGGNNERFFGDVAHRLKIRPDSASGAFYRAMRREGALPDAHKRVYEDLLEISAPVLNMIGRPAITRDPTDPLAAIRGQVADLMKALEVARSEHDKLARRVEDLEQARAGVRGRQPTGAKR